MNRFFIFSCILCTCALQSQAQFAVNGMVAYSTGTGEAYATLRIYNLADTTKAVRLGKLPKMAASHSRFLKQGNTSLIYHR